jgi:hypothetical protein
MINLLLILKIYIFVVYKIKHYYQKYTNEASNTLLFVMNATLIKNGLNKYKL